MRSDATVAVPSLILATHDSDTNARVVAAFALGKIGEPTEPIVEALMSSLADENENVRYSAVRALAKIGPDAEESVRPLYAVVVEDESGDVRSAAAAALASIGHPADMVTDLVQELTHPNWYVRQNFAEALASSTFGCVRTEAR